MTSLIQQIPNRHSPLADQVVEILVARISDGLYPPASKLPSESELAGEFYVSRSTVRAALSTLAARGLVKRVQGSGTFISRLSQISNPLNEVIDYRELITGHGFAYSFVHLGSEIESLESEVARALNLDQDFMALKVKKAFLADSELLIYTINIIPAWVIENHVTLEQLLIPEATEPLFDFLETKCHQRIEAFVATVTPDLAQNVPIADPNFPVDPRLPVLVIEEVGYNSNEEAVLYEVEYLFGDRMKFDLIRRLRR